MNTEAEKETFEFDLPLHPDMERCHAFTGGLGEFCRKSMKCARHRTLLEKDEPWGETKIPHRMLCSDESKHLFLKINKVAK